MADIVFYLHHMKQRVKCGIMHLDYALLGVEATTLTYLSHSFEYPTDINLDLSADTWIEN